MQKVLLFVFASILLCHCQVDTVQYVPYDDDGFKLAGYLALPPTAGPYPAVIILPDWDGVNQYEVKRARMLAGLGMAAFAADIFGEDKREVTNNTERIELYTKYISNATLYLSRIQAAIDLVKQRLNVVNSRIALTGYCFGGTGVINYAISGGDVSGIVSYHGGLTYRLRVNRQTKITAKMLIYSGGDDDPISDIRSLEDELNSVNASWEINRFSKIKHAFTVWSDSRYDARADRRSWEGTLHFLTQLFKPTDPAAIPTQPLASQVPPQAVRVNYTAEDGTPMSGYQVLPNQGTGKVPAVVLIPGWAGVNSYPVERARLVASLTQPYLGFVADIFGAAYQDIPDIPTRARLATLYRTNVSLFVSRIALAVAQARAHPRVDASRIAVAGYCFGGTGVLNYALVGASDVVGVISFHGGLTVRAKGNNTRTVPVLLHSGGSDDTSSSMEELENDLNVVQGVWETTRYSGVLHSFTVWGADGPGEKYDARADLRSWRSMVQFLERFFGGSAAGSVEPSTIVLPTSPNPTDNFPWRIVITIAVIAGVVVIVALALILVCCCRKSGGESV